MKNRYVIRARISEHVFRRFLRHVAADLTAVQIAQLTGLNRNTVNRLLACLRERMAEAEARATFAGLQRKYGNLLGGYSPIVRKTELAGGKTVYRLRVGPFSRDDASSMCSQLQSAGGQCFIARN